MVRLSDRAFYERVLCASIVQAAIDSDLVSSLNPGINPHLNRWMMEAEHWVEDRHARACAIAVRQLVDRSEAVSRSLIATEINALDWSVDSYLQDIQVDAIPISLAEIEAEQFLHRWPRIAAALVSGPPALRKLWSIPRVPESDDPDELIKSRYLCRRGGMLLVAPSGIGKSVFAMQCGIMWSLGLPVFGMVPARPMKIVMVQAENDDGDIAEMRDGIADGLEIPIGTDKDLAYNFSVANEVSRSGEEFFTKTLQPLMAASRPDLVIIDPALAYLGGDASDQTDVGKFLRNGLNPLLVQYECGAMVVHHTTKPSRGVEKASWSAGDWAYMGSGSAEWANWARAVMGIRSLGSHEVFELVAGKRGRRLGWRDENQERAYVQVIKHSSQGICWVVGTDADRPTADAETKAKPGPAPTCSADQVLEILPEAGCTREEWIAAASGLGSRGTIQRRIAELADAKRVLRSHVSGRWLRVEDPGTY